MRKSGELSDLIAHLHAEATLRDDKISMKQIDRLEEIMKDAIDCLVSIKMHHPHFVPDRLVWTDDTRMD